MKIRIISSLTTLLTLITISIMTIEATIDKKKHIRRSVRFSQEDEVHVLPGSGREEEEEEMINGNEIWYSREDLDKFRDNARKEAKDFLKVIYLEAKKDNLEQKQDYPGESLGIFEYGDASAISFRDSLSREDFTDSSSTKDEIIPKDMDVSQYSSCIDYFQRRENIRGLEHRLNYDRYRYRKITMMAVLEAQRRLKEKKSASDEEKAKDFSRQLSMVSSRFSRWSRALAHRIGAMDFLAAAGQFERKIISLEPNHSYYTSTNNTHCGKKTKIDAFRYVCTLEQDALPILQRKNSMGMAMPIPVHSKSAIEQPMFYSLPCRS